MANADGVMVVAPKELIIPAASITITEQPFISGALYLSGAKLYVHIGSPRLITHT